jgi:hypothetical protein
MSVSSVPANAVAEILRVAPLEEVAMAGLKKPWPVPYRRSRSLVSKAPLTRHLRMSFAGRKHLGSDCLMQRPPKTLHPVASPTRPMSRSSM